MPAPDASVVKMLHDKDATLHLIHTGTLLVREFDGLLTALVLLKLTEREGNMEEAMSN